MLTGPESFMQTARGRPGDGGMQETRWWLPGSGCSWLRRQIQQEAGGRSDLELHSGRRDDALHEQTSGHEPRNGFWNGGKLRLQLRGRQAWGWRLADSRAGFDGKAAIWRLAGWKLAKSAARFGWRLLAATEAVGKLLARPWRWQELVFWARLRDWEKRGKWLKNRGLVFLLVFGLVAAFYWDKVWTPPDRQQSQGELSEFTKYDHEMRGVKSRGNGANDTGRVKLLKQLSFPTFNQSKREDPTWASDRKNGRGTNEKQRRNLLIWWLNLKKSNVGSRKT